MDRIQNVRFSSVVEQSLTADGRHVNRQMGRTTSFKDEFTFEQRLEESRDILAKYPNRLPVIVEKYARSRLPEMEKKKYLVPRDMSIGQFIYILTSRLRLDKGKALFVFVNNTLPQTASLMESVYESSKDDDGFLYMCYSTEKTFGYIEISHV